MEILLIIWTALLGLWTAWLYVGTLCYHKANSQLQLDRIRWARHCENVRRGQNYERN